MSSNYCVRSADVPSYHPAHAQPGMEQVCYLLEGTARVVRPVAAAS